MRKPAWFLSSFNRGNLRYEVKLKKGKVVKEIAALIKTNFFKNRKFQSGIVYCLSKKECDETAKQLQILVPGLTCRPYHAGQLLWTEVAIILPPHPQTGQSRCGI